MHACTLTAVVTVRGYGSCLRSCLVHTHTNTHTHTDTYTHARMHAEQIKQTETELIRQVEAEEIELKLLGAVHKFCK